MLAIDVIYVGGDKERYYAEACREYAKRLGAFCSFQFKSVKDETLPERAGEKEIALALEKEAKRLLDSCDSKSYKIALCIEGKQLSSEDLAVLLDDLPGKGYSRLSFFIGSSEGLHDRVKQACDARISMSRMTFPHRLARVMLSEQIYRALSINGGRRYHK